MLRMSILAAVAVLSCSQTANAIDQQLLQQAAICRQHVHALERRVAGVAPSADTSPMFDKGWEHCEVINKAYNDQFLAEQSHTLTTKEQQDQAATKAFADKLKK